jgi:hypothetical protein
MIRAEFPSGSILDTDRFISQRVGDEFLVQMIRRTIAELPNVLSFPTATDNLYCAAILIEWRPTQLPPPKFCHSSRKSLFDLITA